MKRETPFSLAVRDGDDDVMQTLINASLTASIERGGSALCRAVADGDYERVRSLAIQSNVSLVTENQNGETALHLAAKKGDDKILEALLNVVRDNGTRNKALNKVPAEESEGENAPDADFT